MNMKRIICALVLAAAGAAVLTACQSGSSQSTGNPVSESSHVIPYGGGSRSESSEATPLSEAEKAANDLFNSANYALIDMKNSNIDITKMNGDYTFRGSDCEGKTMRSSAKTEAELLSGLQGGMLYYFDKVTEVDEIAVHIENGKCTATAAGKEGVYACYPHVDSTTAFTSLNDALSAGFQNAQ